MGATVQQQGTCTKKIYDPKNNDLMMSYCTKLFSDKFQTLKNVFLAVICIPVKISWLPVPAAIELQGKLSTCKLNAHQAEYNLIILALSGWVMYPWEDRLSGLPPSPLTDGENVN